uniref:type IX secretion system protein PorG n=1 Tax=uncultured Draconibacterium sp. TaxID=1573823 RepID=UPI00321638D7
MKKLLLVFVTVLVTVSGYAQKTADIGIWGGSSALWGDMDENYPFQTFNLNYGAYFRYNINARVGIRAMFLNGTFANDDYVENTPWSFDKNVSEFTVQAEINYLRYILGERKMRFSPYVTIGLGISYFKYDFRPEEIMLFNPDYPKLETDESGGYIGQDESVAAPTIPFGIGVKYTIGERLGIGVEYQMRKYMSDQLDDLDDPLSHINTMEDIVTYNDGNHNNDWGGYLGVHVTYKIYIGKKACPAYDSKNW